MLDWTRSPGADVFFDDLVFMAFFLMIAVPFPSPFAWSERLVASCGKCASEGARNGRHDSGRAQKGDGIGRHSARSKKSLKTSAALSRAAPRGWEGRAMGGVGATGEATPLSDQPRRIRRMASRLPARLAPCLRTLVVPRRARGRVCRHRDRLAVFLGTLRCYVSLHRAVGWVGGLGGRRRGPIAEGPAERVSAMGRK